MKLAVRAQAFSYALDTFLVAEYMFHLTGLFRESSLVSLYNSVNRATY